MLFALLKVSLKLGIIGPDLNAKAMLSILDPVPDELGTVAMLVRALAMRLVVEPVSFVDVAVGVDQAAFSICFVILPIAYELRSITPYLRASTFAITGLKVPLALVDSSIIQFKWTFFHQILNSLLLIILLYSIISIWLRHLLLLGCWWVGVEDEWTQSLLGFARKLVGIVRHHLELLRTLVNV